jgi:hypothetical protein
MCTSFSDLDRYGELMSSCSDIGSSILHQARKQWRGAEPAAADAVNSIGRRQVGAASQYDNFIRSDQLFKEGALAW